MKINKQHLWLANETWWRDKSMQVITFSESTVWAKTQDPAKFTTLLVLSSTPFDGTGSATSIPVKRIGGPFWKNQTKKHHPGFSLNSEIVWTSANCAMQIFLSPATWIFLFWQFWVAHCKDGPAKQCSLSKEDNSPSKSWKWQGSSVLALIWRTAPVVTTTNIGASWSNSLKTKLFA